jgi:hypothetical protein
LELEVDVDEPDDDELADGVEVVAGGELEVVVVELLEFDPQAVAASAASTSRTAAQWRGERFGIAWIMWFGVLWI